MNILDENIFANQREMLQSWRIRVRQIGHDLERMGIQDDEIITLLHRQRQATFFTRDLGFYERRLCHGRYCLVCLAVEKHEVANFERRVLRHPMFDTQARRMGAVIRVSQTGIRVWRLHAEHDSLCDWV